MRKRDVLIMKEPQRSGLIADGIARYATEENEETASEL